MHKQAIEPQLNSKPCEKVAIILNSGLGARLRPKTDNIPKCLTEVLGSSVLERQISSLVKHGVSRFIITTGHFDKKIIDFVKTKFPNIDVSYVRNGIYRTTNYIYSLYLTKEMIEKAEVGQVLLIHGDLVWNDEVVQRMVVKNELENSVIVFPDMALPEKDFKCLVSKKSGLIEKVCIHLKGGDDKRDCYFLLPFYQLSKKYFMIWLDEMDRFCNKIGKRKVYAEHALNEIHEKLKIKPNFLSTKDCYCMEIDTIEDLDQVSLDFKKYQ